MRSGALMAMALTIVAAGCAAAALRQPATRIEIIPRTTPVTKIAGGSARQRAPLRGILARMGPTRVRSIEIVADTGRDPHGPPDAVAFQAKGNTRFDPLAAWQADVVGRVFARRSQEL